MNSTTNDFELCGEIFDKTRVPNIYSMYQTNPEHAEALIQSLVKAYGGGVVGAVQALESDLAHDSAL